MFDLRSMAADYAGEMFVHTFLCLAGEENRVQLGKAKRRGERLYPGCIPSPRLFSSLLAIYVTKNDYLKPPKDTKVSWSLGRVFIIGGVAVQDDAI